MAKASKPQGPGAIEQLANWVLAIRTNDVPAKIPELKPEQGGFNAVIYSPETVDADTDRWAKIYDEIFR